MQRKSPQIPHLYGLYKFWAEKSDNSKSRKMPKPLLIFYNSFCPEIWNACAMRFFAACRLQNNRKQGHFCKYSMRESSLGLICLQGKMAITNEELDLLCSLRNLSRRCVLHPRRSHRQNDKGE